MVRRCPGSSRKPQDSDQTVELLDFETSIAPDSEADMAWTIGDEGFDMALSTYIPKILGSNVETGITPLLKRMKIYKDDIDQWGVHPGGRAILDKIQQGLNLKDEQVEPSHEVLRQYGNMRYCDVCSE